MKFRNVIAPVLIFILFCYNYTAEAQDEKDLFPGGRYDSAVPTPLEITGHRFGELHTFYWEMENFINAVADKSDRVVVCSYGRTYQGRKLYMVFVSSPENIRRLEDIRTANLKLTDPRITSASEAEQIVESLPSIVWLGCNIHGNEVSAGESAIRIIYQLAAGMDDVTQNILRNVVTIIDPVQNPDGRERYVNYQRSVTTLQSHPQQGDVEHLNPWPGGRTNHYLFDLNRDFFLKTQIESRQKAEAYHKWMPHVFPDLHEMDSNSTYFFAPPMDPYNKWVTDFHFKWWDIIADGNAKAFDQFGWGYYTKESFDAFYPGYGVSYPSINGAIGMTYEQASSRGVSTTRDDGYILTLRETSWHHFTSFMATLRTIAERRKEKVLDFYKYFVSAFDEADREEIKEIILLPGHDPQITAKLVENMLIEGVEIERALESFTCKRATSYMSKNTGAQTFPAGTYIIRLRQPQMRLVRALLAPDSPIDPQFIKEERERQEKREGSRFYDVTAWSMPLTYGIEAYWSESESKVSTERVLEPPEFSGSIAGGKAQQVYLIPFNTLAASKMLARLMAEDFRVRIARKEFTIEGKTWPVGTLVVRVNRNRDAVHSRIAELAGEFGVNVTALNTGLSTGGIDIGSNNIAALQKPSIAIVAESPASAYSYGAMHYLFEREFGLDFTRITAADLGSLADYNIVLLPSGNYSAALSGTRLNTFKSWIRAGGTVLTVSGSTSWLRTAEISQASLLNGRKDPETGKLIQPWQTPGAIVKVNINPLSFMSYGVASSVAGFVRSGNIYAPFNDKFRDAGVYAPAGEAKLSGWVWPETEKYLAGAGYLFVEQYGSGKLILFTEDPNFRASYDGLNKLFLNGILLGPSLN